MGVGYLLFHGFVHLLIIALIFYVFQLDYLNLFLVFLTSALVDADHLPFIKKYGWKHWFKIAWKTHEPRGYPLHNIFILAIFLVVSLLILILYPQFFILGILLLSVALHLVWDLFEDVVIFKMGIKHWL